MMNDQQKYLDRIKKLISEGKRRFEQRKDRDYLEDLFELGITKEEAWDYILRLNFHFYFPDPKPSYHVGQKGLTFKRPINGVMAYIKVKIEGYDDEEVVCISFHKDKNNRR